MIKKRKPRFPFEIVGTTWPMDREWYGVTPDPEIYLLTLEEVDAGLAKGYHLRALAHPKSPYKAGQMLFAWDL